MKKTATIKIGGNADYSKVKERLKEFRSDNPRGSIKTKPTIEADYLLFEAYVLKDKADPTSADSTGHSYIATTDSNKEKFFEKQETIAIGRALANLGYASDGEIASSEEMEAFQEHLANQKFEALEQAKDRIHSATSIEELKEIWADFNGEMKVAMKGLLDTKKIELNEKGKTATKKPRVVRVPSRKNIGEPTEGHHSEEGNGS